MKLFILAGILALSTMTFAANTATKSLSITVTPAAVQITTSATLPSGQQGVAYTTTLSATGGVGAPYTWTVSSGTLPNGVTLSSSGVLSGISTLQGAFTFTIKATDSGGNSAATAFSLTMITAPTLAITSTTPLPAAQVGVVYAQTLTASGGVAPYTWSLASGSTLPAGLSLSSSGVISGTPTTNGSFSFTAQVSDSAGN